MRLYETRRIYKYKANEPTNEDEGGLHLHTLFIHKAPAPAPTMSTFHLMCCLLRTADDKYIPPSSNQLLQLLPAVIRCAL